MNRLGWTILIVILIVGGAFLSMLHFGGSSIRRAAPTSTPTAAELEGPTGLPRLAIPVAGYDRADLRDDWGDPREDGRRLHHGTDLMAPGGTLVRAAADGRIEKLFESGKGGTTIYERSPDGHWQYYYAHLSGYVSGVHEGQAVRTGDPLGYVGDTGDAGPGNYHLHFGLTFMRPGKGWWQGQPVNPYPMLAGKTGGG